MFHGLMRHFANTGMCPELADILTLRGSSNHNLKRDHKIKKDQNGGELDDPLFEHLPKYLSEEPPFLNHAILAHVNELAKARGRKIPFAGYIALDPNTGEVFLSKYFFEQLQRIAAGFGSDRDGFCQCPICRSTPIEFDVIECSTTETIPAIEIAPAIPANMETIPATETVPTAEIVPTMHLPTTKIVPTVPATETVPAIDGNALNTSETPQGELLPPPRPQKRARAALAVPLPTPTQPQVSHPQPTSPMRPLPYSLYPIPTVPYQYQFKPPPPAAPPLRVPQRPLPKEVLFPCCNKNREYYLFEYLNQKRRPGREPHDNWCHARKKG